jgi:alpha-beta hydrolase superfamily lysophospholipase
MRQWVIDPQAEEAHITATDGAVLRAACFHPMGEPRGAVIILHGIGDHGYSMAGLAQLFRLHGYIALTPDSRAHGGSGGSRITYGLRERDDVHRWVDWIESRYHPAKVYGYGASMGGGVIIQSLAVESRFRAIIAECPFSDFRRAAYDRVSERFFMVPKPLLAPVIEPAFLYARMRLGLDLSEASPEAVLRDATTPVLLIHGTADDHLPIEHSRRLHAANPAHSELWEVPGAGHVGAWAAAGEEFERRVLAWVQDH